MTLTCRLGITPRVGSIGYYDVDSDGEEIETGKACINVVKRYCVGFVHCRNSSVEVENTGYNEYNSSSIPSQIYSNNSITEYPAIAQFK